MSKDIERIIQDLTKKQDKNDDKISKDIASLDKDIAYIKKQIQSIDDKIELVLEILNNFTLMILDEEEENELDNEYSNNDEWVPEQEEDWNYYEDDNG